MTGSLSPVEASCTPLAATQLQHLVTTTSPVEHRPAMEQLSQLAGTQPGEQCGAPEQLAAQPFRQEHHPGKEGQLAVDVKQDENAPNDPIYSTGAPSDMAQDTTVAAAPVAALPGIRQGMPADTPASGRPDTDTSSPSTGNDNMPDAAAVPVTAEQGAAAVAAAAAAVLMPPQPLGLQHQQPQLLEQPHLEQQQQQQVSAAAEEQDFAAAADAEAQQQPHHHQPQQQHYSLGLELLGEAAALGLAPQDSQAAAEAAAGRLAAGHNGMSAAAAMARQSRMSHNQVLLDGGMYDHLPMPTPMIVPKPDGVQCQVGERLQQLGVPAVLGHIPTVLLLV